MPVRKKKQRQPDEETTADNKTAAVNPSAHDMVSTVMHEMDSPANQDESPAEEKEQDSRRPDRKGPGARRTDPVGIAAGVCLFGGEGGRPLLGALGLLEPRRDPRRRTPRRSGESIDGRRPRGNRR